MPHLVIECSQPLSPTLANESAQRTLHDVLLTSGQFGTGDIKVRTHSYDSYLVAGAQDDFVHVILWLMHGRSDDIKAELSASIANTVQALITPAGACQVTVDVRDMAKATYSKVLI